RGRDRRARGRALPRPRDRLHERQHARRAPPGARDRGEARVSRLRPAVVVHYHEIGLKRGNRPLFLRHLAKNLTRATSELGPVHPMAGPGGLPVGASGTVAALLSGGIDSPVAAWRMMKRGCRVAFVHFHIVPYLPATSQAKARALVERLSAWQYESRLVVVPFR